MEYITQVSFVRAIKGSGRDNCMYLYSKIVDKENDMGQRIVKTQSVFLCTGKQKEGLIRTTHNI